MAIGDHDVLARAARILRAEPEPGWTELQPRVIEAVRATPRGGWPITVEDPEPNGDAGTLAVSDLAVRALLARALRADPDVAPLGIDVDVADGELLGVRVELVGRYGTDLPAAAARTADRCAAVLADAVGRSAAAVEVVVVDVERRGV